VPRILLLSRLLFIQLNAQVDCSREMLKLTLKFTLKCSYMFRFNKPSSGSLLLCFAKVIIIKIIKNVVLNQFGRVAAYLSITYWCVYSAQCRVCTVRSAECVKRAVQSVHSAQCRVCTVDIAECVHCTVQSVYSAQCRVYTVRSAECVQCRVCTMYSARCRVCTARSAECVQCAMQSVYSAQCRVCTARSAECVQCTV